MSNPHANHQGEPGDRGLAYWAKQIAFYTDGIGGAATPTVTLLRDLAENLDGRKIIENREGWARGLHSRADLLEEAAREIRKALASAPSPEAGAGGDLGELDDVQAALKDCSEAVAFFDQVKRSTQAEQIAVGADHWNWLEAACRRTADVHRSGKLVAFTGSGKEETKGEPSGTGYSSETTPYGRGPAGEYPSRVGDGLCFRNPAPDAAAPAVTNARTITISRDPDRFASQSKDGRPVMPEGYSAELDNPLIRKPAPATEAGTAETGTGSVHEGAAPTGETPETCHERKAGFGCKFPHCECYNEATPQQSPSPTTETDPPMSVEEARETVQGINPEFGSPEDYVAFLRFLSAKDASPGGSMAFDTKANRIEAAIRIVRREAEAPR